MRLPPIKIYSSRSSHPIYRNLSSSISRPSSSSTAKLSLSSTPPSPSPSSSSTSALLSPAVSDEIALNPVLNKALHDETIGILLAELGRTSQSDSKLTHGKEHSPSELEKIVNIHRALKEQGIHPKVLRIAMDRLVGLGLFDPTQSPLQPTSVPLRRPLFQASRPSSSRLTESNEPPSISATTLPSAPSFIQNLWSESSSADSSKPSSSTPSPPNLPSSSTSAIKDNILSRRASESLPSVLKIPAATLEGKPKPNPDASDSLSSRWTTFLKDSKPNTNVNDLPETTRKTGGKARTKFAAVFQAMADLDLKDGRKRLEERRDRIVAKLVHLEALGEKLGERKKVHVRAKKSRMKYQVVMETLRGKEDRKDASTTKGSLGSGPSSPLPSPTNDEVKPSSSSSPSTSAQQKAGSANIYSHPLPNYLLLRRVKQLECLRTASDLRARREAFFQRSLDLDSEDGGGRLEFQRGVLRRRMKKLERRLRIRGEEEEEGGGAERGRRQELEKLRLAWELMEEMRGRRKRAGKEEEEREGEREKEDRALAGLPSSSPSPSPSPSPSTAESEPPALPLSSSEPSTISSSSPSKPTSPPSSNPTSPPSLPSSPTTINSSASSPSPSPPTSSSSPTLDPEPSLSSSEPNPSPSEREEKEQDRKTTPEVVDATTKKGFFSGWFGGGF